MPKAIRTIFVGTSEFGVPSLKRLLEDADFDIKLVLTQPDKKAGRRQETAPPPIKQIALKNNIPVKQPENISEFSLNPGQIDLIVVIAYAQIIPPGILNAPCFGCVNVHGSLLPKYRGASCINWPIINNEPESGISLIKMDQGLDTGGIICRHKLAIEENDTAGSLFQKLSALSAEHISGDLKKYISGKAKPRKQDENRATYVKQLKKADGLIDWQKTAGEIERFVRGMHPWPGAFARLKDGRTLKILESGKDFLTHDGQPGTLFFKNNAIYISARDRALPVKRVQLAGKKPMSAREFVNGHKNLDQTALNS